MRLDDLRLATLALALSCAWATTARAQDLPVVHALLVADNLDPAIGPGGLHDIDGVEGALRTGLGSERLKVRKLKDQDSTPEAILEYYQNLQVNSSDVLLFHYAGHGGMPDGPRGHTFSMQGNRRLMRHDLRNAMKAKGTPLIVMLTDCCSSGPQKLRPRAQRDLVYRVSPRSVEPGFQQLFFRTRGIVDITAAQDDKPSIGDTVKYGGLFSSALHNGLTKAAKNPDVTWADFHSIVKDEMAALEERYNYPDQSSRAFGIPGSYWGFTASRKGRGEGELACISDVHLDSVAERAGLRSDDVVVTAGGRSIRRLEDLVSEIGRLQRSSPLRLTVKRDGEILPIVVDRP